MFVSSDARSDAKSPRWEGSDDTARVTVNFLHMFFPLLTTEWNEGAGGLLRNHSSRDCESRSCSTKHADDFCLRNAQVDACSILRTLLTCPCCAQLDRPAAGGGSRTPGE